MPRALARAGIRATKNNWYQKCRHKKKQGPKPLPILLDASVGKELPCFLQQAKLMGL